MYPRLIVYNSSSHSTQSTADHATSPLDWSNLTMTDMLQVFTLTKEVSEEARVACGHQAVYLQVRAPFIASVARTKVPKVACSGQDQNSNTC